MNDQVTESRWMRSLRVIGPELAARAAAHDETDRFVAEGYARLKEHRFFSAGIPAVLGGGGASHQELCRMVRELAHSCGSTALAFGMHTHPVAVNVFKYRRGQPAEAMLRKVAEQELIICGTGGQDWMESSGTMEKVDRGYRVTATKHFVSGAPAADLLVTSARFEDPQEGAQVLHFAVAMGAKGMSRNNVWTVHGMRGTGSEDVILDGVFVPDEAIVAKRPAGSWHPMWNVILPIALPIFMAAYVGLAEAAADEGRKSALKRSDRADVQAMTGEMQNELLIAQMALDSMIEDVDDYAFEPTLGLTSRTLGKKTMVSQAVKRSVELAANLVGGPSYFRTHRVERISRDIRAAHFHPLPEPTQHLFSGRVALERDPIHG